MTLLILSSWQSATGTTFLSVNQSVGLEVTPTYQGKFTVNGEAYFPLDIQNTSSHPDQYYISGLPTNPLPNEWSFVAYGPNRNQLQDTDNDGKLITDSIGAGYGIEISIKAIAPGGADIGSNKEINLIITSKNDISQMKTVKLQVAVPTAFGQAVNSSETGVDLVLIWPNSQRKITLSKLFTGSSLAAATLLDNGYMYVWERTDSSGDFQNIEYALISGAGLLLQGEKDLTTNQGESTQIIKDLAPSLTVDPKNGLVGIVWERDIFKYVDGNTQELSNIFMMVFNPATRQAQALENVTKNYNDWWKSGSSAPLYSRPIIKSMGGQFFITWEERRQDNVANIGLAAYSSGGQEIILPKLITDSQTDQTRYKEPGIASLTGNRILVTYTRYNDINDINDSNPAYQLLDASGENILIGGAKSEFIPVYGNMATATELGNHNILMSWTQLVDDAYCHGKQICYVLLDPVSYQPVNATLKELPTPDGRESDFVSASIDGNGYGILTWLDKSHTQQLYYALINQDGSIRTPAIAFNQGGLNPGLTVNGSGYSLASYMGSYLTHLPLTVKK
jgi:hypothetical protein